MRRVLGQILGALIVVSILAVGWSRLWKGDYIFLGGDEGMEMAKAILSVKAPEDLKRCWTDQPWLYSMWIGRLWKIGGEDWNWARAFSALSALLWIWATIQIAPQKKRFLHTFFITLCMASWPGFFLLSFSTMVELPVMMLCTLGVAVLSHKQWSLARGILGAIFAGIACGMKLIALLAFPAWILAILSAEPALWPRNLRQDWLSFLKEIGKRLFPWFLVWITVFISLLFLGPQENQHLFSTHWKSAVYLWSHGAGIYHLRLDSIWPCLISLIGSIIGIFWLWRRGRFYEALLPATLFLVPLILHLFFIRPFWDFYMLHFTAGVAALAGWILGEWIYILWQGLWNKKISALRFEYILIMASFLLAGLCMIQVPNAWENAKTYLSLPSKKGDEVFQTLMTLRLRIRRGFAQPGAYLTQAGILPIPELARAHPKNRFEAMTEVDLHSKGNLFKRIIKQAKKTND